MSYYQLLHFISICPSLGVSHFGSTCCCLRWDKWMCRAGDDRCRLKTVTHSLCLFPCAFSHMVMTGQLELTFTYDAPGHGQALRPHTCKPTFFSSSFYCFLTLTIVFQGKQTKRYVLFQQQSVSHKYSCTNLHLRATLYTLHLSVGHCPVTLALLRLLEGVSGKENLCYSFAVHTRI